MNSSITVKLNSIYAAINNHLTDLKYEPFCLSIRIIDTIIMTSVSPFKKKGTIRGLKSIIKTVTKSD